MVYEEEYWKNAKEYQKKLFLEYYTDLCFCALLGINYWTKGEDQYGVFW